MEIFNWQAIPAEQVSPWQTRAVIHMPAATFVRLVSLKGATIPLHNHVHEQVTILLSGAFRFDLENESVVLRAGDVLRIPSNVPHSAEALEESVTIEVFTPAREDWIHAS